MSIYRRKSAAGSRSKFWTAEFQFAGKLYRKNGFPDRDSARDWIARQSRQLRRIALGCEIAPDRSAAVDPLIEAFARQLRQRGRDEMYVYTTERRLMRLAEQCRWITLMDVTVQSLDRWMEQLHLWRGRPIGQRTKNQFADSAQEFGRWLSHPKIAKLPNNPLAGADRRPAPPNHRYRRAATLAELQALLSTCPPDRRLFYLFRIYSPMRARTLSALTWGMLNLDASPPFALTPAAANESRREEKHILRYDVAQELRRSRGKASDADPVFACPPALEALKIDLAAAGVPFSDSQGNRRLDFHALRRTLVRLAKAAGATLEQASLLIGHADPSTTRKWYDEDSIDPAIGQTIESLPSLLKIRRAQ